jgi:hypothetical protein
LIFIIRIYRACDLYSSALWLIEAVQLTASEPEDKSVLLSFANALREQYETCKQKCSVLFPVSTKTTKADMIQRLGESAAAVGNLQIKQQLEKQMIQQQPTESLQFPITTPAGSALMYNAPITQSMILNQQQHPPGHGTSPGLGGQFNPVMRRNSNKL